MIRHETPREMRGSKILALNLFFTHHVFFKAYLEPETAIYFFVYKIVFQADDERDH